jgi:hypothetical protein
VTLSAVFAFGVSAAQTPAPIIVAIIIVPADAAAFIRPFRSTSNIEALSVEKILPD